MIGEVILVDTMFDLIYAQLAIVYWRCGIELTPN